MIGQSFSFAAAAFALAGLAGQMSQATERPAD
jgi:hypothetical protein